MSQFYRKIAAYIKKLRALPQAVLDLRFSLAELQAGQDYLRAALLENRAGLAKLAGREPDAETRRQLERLQRLALLEALYPGLLRRAAPCLPEYPSMADDFLLGAADDEEALFEQAADLTLGLLRKATSRSEAENAAVWRELLRKSRGPRRVALHAEWLESLARAGAGAREIIEAGRAFESLPGAWEGGRGNWYFRAAWLRYLMALEEAGLDNEARRIMAKYVELYGLWELPCCLPAAFLAEKYGHADEAILRSAGLHRIFREQETNDYPWKFFEGRSIAVVGNAPCERDKGAEIDAHDIVVRFSEFPCSPEYINDYGSKTDIWVMNSKVLSTLEAVAVPASIKAVLPAANPWLHDYPLKNVKALADLAARDFMIMPFTRAMSSAGNKICPLRWPTAGATLLAWLKTRDPSFPAARVYGFSFKSGRPADRYAWEHYGESLPGVNAHNLNVEIKALRKLFGLSAPAAGES